MWEKWGKIMTINKIICLVMNETVMKFYTNETSEKLASLMEKISLVLDMLSFYYF